MKNKLPQTAVIEKMSHDGRGVARIEGKTTFIEGALPQESVLFETLRQKKDFSEGRVLSVISPSADRVIPHCPHVNVCGGCSLQHYTPEAQVMTKQDWLLEMIARTAKTEAEEILTPLIAEPWHYRQKARLSVRYVTKKQATLVGFREKHQPRYITDIQTCSVLHQRVDKLISPLRQLLDTFDEPQTIAQIEVAVGDEAVALIFRNLSVLTEQDTQRLHDFGQQYQLDLFLQPGGMETIQRFYPANAGDFLTYSLPDYALQFYFHPSDFMQVNAAINRQMVTQALKLMALEPTDHVLDLFCGLGNFSLPMARTAQHVVGVEGSAHMVTRAQMNADHNGLNNTAFYAANLDDEKALSHFPHQNINKLLLDPPRTGAMMLVNQIEKIQPERIVYVSCNPATLARDTAILVHEKGYRLRQLGVMDMFPHTAHVESIAVFE